MNDDDNDLTERFPALKGDTLEDEWEDDPEPPMQFGMPDPRTIMEQVEQYWWVWQTGKVDAEIRFEGEAMEIQQ